MCLLASSRIRTVDCAKTLRIKDFDNLRLHICVIGYPVMGESVVAMLCESDKVLFTVVTDSYCCEENGNGYNYVVELLKKKGVGQIDAFVWTHPDKDHSIGIECLLDIYDSQHTAEIFIPEGLIGKNQETFCNETISAIGYIYANYSPKGSRKDRRNIHTVSTDFQEIRDLMKLNIVADDFESMTCKFRFVQPYSEYCHHCDFWDIEQEHNLMSIVYSIELNGRNYLFTGDLMDDGTRMMSHEILSRINYVKIPHHGSKHSKELLNILRNYSTKGLTSSATSFNSSGAPQPKVLQAYSDMGNVYYVTDDRTHPIGCIETIVGVVDDVCTTLCTGNAIQFCSIA